MQKLYDTLTGLLLCLVYVAVRAATAVGDLFRRKGE